MTQEVASANVPLRAENALQAAPAVPLKVSGAILCLVPWLLATLFKGSPELSWGIAWLGSLAILALVFTGRVFSLPSDRMLSDQILRPWFLLHLVFAGYNFLTAVFFWMDLHGITLGLADSIVSSIEDTMLAAEAQRFYVLAHAGLAIGLGLARQIPERLRFRRTGENDMATTLLVLAVGSVILKGLFGVLPGLSQFAVKMQALSVVSAGMSTGVAMRTRSRWLAVALVTNLVMMIIALGSGWKEEVFVLILLNASSFFATAPIRTTLATGVLFAFGMVILPAVVGPIRQNVWNGELTKTEGLRLAVDEVKSKTVPEFKMDTWAFLTGRLSEEGLFVEYLRDVPANHPYDGPQIVYQALLAPVPRIFWRGKPDLEQQVMSRVFAHGIVAESSDVSAKPQFVVDAFLSAGAPGVFFALLWLGWTAQTACRFCEQYLGGYFLGGVAFNGLFSIFWRGNCFEYTTNAVVWSFILMLLLIPIAEITGVTRRA